MWGDQKNEETGAEEEKSDNIKKLAGTECVCVDVCAAMGNKPGERNRDQWMKSHAYKFRFYRADQELTTQMPT